MPAEPKKVEEASKDKNQVGQQVIVPHFYASPNVNAELQAQIDNIKSRLEADNEKLKHLEDDLSHFTQLEAEVESKEEQLLQENQKVEEAPAAL